jgi:transcriptional regulator with PAS, ATPase and Fis domain
MAEEPQDAPLSIERTMIRNALEQAHRDKVLAARLLGISQTEHQKRIEACGMTTDGSPEESLGAIWSN